MRYRNVTVSGEIASGTSTLARQLAGRLGWKYMSLGEWFREYCRKRGLALEEAGLRSDELTRQVDGELKQRLKTEDHLVAEGWLTGYMALDIPGVLKVLLIAPFEVRVKRFGEREGIEENEARLHLEKRTRENITKWQRIYGVTDFWRPDAYDLVIDTGVNGKEQTLAEVYGKIAGINDGNFSQAGAKD